MVDMAAARAEEAARQAIEEAQRAQMWKDSAASFQKFHNANQRAGIIKKDIERLLSEVRDADDKSATVVEKCQYQLIQLRDLSEQMDNSRRLCERSGEEVAKKARDLLQDRESSSPVVSASGAQTVKQTKDLTLWVSGSTGFPVDVAAGAVCRCFANSRPNHQLFENSLAKGPERQDASSAVMKLTNFHLPDALLFSLWHVGGAYGQQEVYLGMAVLHGSVLTSDMMHTATLPICGGQFPDASLNLTIDVKPHVRRAPMAGAGVGSWLGGAE
jgi:hypothetical protein